MKRRDFLKLTAAASAAAVPTLWLPRRAMARTPAFGTAKHLLVLNAKGGLRSHATFNAVGTSQHNPFGTQSAASGTEWALGAACGAHDIVTSNGVVDAFAKRTNRVAVVACVDHVPDGTPDMDHVSASNRIGTGSPDGGLGLLTRIAKSHPMYASGFSLDAVPPVEIVPSEFGAGTGSDAKYRPLSVSNPTDAFDSTYRIEDGWNLRARNKLDERFLARNPKAYAQRLTAFNAAKTSAATFSTMLQNPRLNVIGAANASDAGVTNGEMIEILGNYTMDTIGDMEPMPSWGPSVAQALRFFGFGSPAAVVTNDIYDMHDNERTGYAPRTRDLVRQLAGLDELLHRMTHPAGGTYWDHTVVAVVSEFSRNNTFADTGFNSGDGSDHVGEMPDPARNQAIAVMGGPVTAAGRLIGATDREMRATGKVFDTRALLATFLDVLGVDGKEQFGFDPIGELFA